MIDDDELNKRCNGVLDENEFGDLHVPKLQLEREGDDSLRQRPRKTAVGTWDDAPEISLWDEHGNHIGGMRLKHASNIARSRGLRMFLIDPHSRPPSAQLFDLDADGSSWMTISVPYDNEKDHFRLPPCSMALHIDLSAFSDVQSIGEVADILYDRVRKRFGGFSSLVLPHGKQMELAGEIWQRLRASGS